ALVLIVDLVLANWRVILNMPFRARSIRTSSVARCMENVQLGEFLIYLDTFYLLRLFGQDFAAELDHALPNLELDLLEGLFTFGTVRKLPSRLSLPNFSASFCVAL